MIMLNKYATLINHQKTLPERSMGVISRIALLPLEAFECVTFIGMITKLGLQILANTQTYEEIVGSRKCSYCSIVSS